MESTSQILTEESKREARSISPRDTKFGLELIELDRRKGNTYKYYKDKENGEIFYTSSSTDNFEKEIQELDRQRKVKRYGRKYA